MYLFDQPSPNFPWKEIVTVLISSVTALITVYNWQASRRRAKLKDDLDILRRYREEFDENLSVSESVKNDGRYTALRDKIQRRMYRVYVLRGTGKSDVFTGIAVIAMSLIPWMLPITLNLALRIGISVVLVPVGLFLIYMGFRDRSLPREFEKADVHLQTRGNVVPGGGDPDRTE